MTWEGLGEKLIDFDNSIAIIYHISSYRPLVSKRNYQE